MRRLLIAGLAVLLAGCGGNPPPNAVPSTTTPPTATAAPASLTDIDLAPMLAAEGDLPAGYTITRMEPELESFYGKMSDPFADAILTQTFENPEDMRGTATILAYTDSSATDATYARLVEGFGASRRIAENLGDHGRYSQASSVGLPEARVVFIRCRAVVYLHGYGTTTADPALLIAWGKKIDQRIQASPICQK
jgi:hypothetical protein